MNQPIRILIVDDHPVVRAGLRGMLSSQADFEIVGEAADGAECLELVSKLNPMVILMDLRMPGMDGVTAIQRIHQSFKGIYILVLTTYDSDADILRATEAGATGYILKDAPREELFRAVRTTASGHAYLAPQVATRLLGQMRTPHREELSEREIEVLDLVAKGKSNKEIATQLHVSVATVKSHLLHIYAKLGVDDRTQAVTTAIQRGLIHLRPSD